MGKTGNKTPAFAGSPNACVTLLDFIVQAFMAAALMGLAPSTRAVSSTPSPLLFNKHKTPSSMLPLHTASAVTSITCLREGVSVTLARHRNAPLVRPLLLICRLDFSGKNYIGILFCNALATPQANSRRGSLALGSKHMQKPWKHRDSTLLEYGIWAKLAKFFHII